MFTDLVGFSDWSLATGDEATLRLLRKVAAAVEPPLLDRGGHIVKRMGDGLMAVFPATRGSGCRGVGGDGRAGRRRG